jgi:starch synthase
MSPIKVLSVASEIFPLVKTGGLADVVGALPSAVAADGIISTTLVPGYPAVLRALEGAEPAFTFENLFGGPARLLAGSAGPLDLLVIDAPHLYGRTGLPYTGVDGRDWPDNAQRFAALGKVAAMVGSGLVPGIQPDILHVHDWQAGLAPAYLHYGGGRRPPVVCTIHNMAFQGVFPRHLLEVLGFPAEAFTIDGIEYHGQISYLKAALQFADRITTVSPTYALEIQTNSGGMGLDGLLRARSHVVSGILNGIDETIWNPARDPHLRAGFDAASIDQRAVNKADLQARFGLTPDPAALLFGVVSRLSEQKGLDLLLQVLPSVFENGGQLVLLGAGDRGLEDGFRRAAASHPGRIGVTIGFDEELAHRIQGGADALLVPSRFEPCGLTQLCALRYGAVPVVARVGGLADTVIDANEMALASGVATGIQFAPVDALMLSAAIDRAAALWADRIAWQMLQRNGMAADVGWSRPAQHYADLYRSLVGRHARHLSQ